MADKGKITPIPALGADRLSESRLIINKNFDLLADAVNDIIDWTKSDAVNNYYTEDIEWESGKEKGPTPILTLHDYDRLIGQSIPVATQLNSGVVNTGVQTFGGTKVFPSGIKANNIKGTNGGVLFTQDGKSICLGGSGSGLKMTFDEKGNFKSWVIPNEWKRSIVTSSGLENKIDGISTLLANISKQEYDLMNSLADVNSQFGDLENQIDKEVSNWFNYGSPSTDKEPEHGWLVPDKREEHVGDTYTDLESKRCYKYVKKTTDMGTVYYDWDEIDQPEIVKALLAASAAQSAADGKVTTYFGAPVDDEDNYQVGDMWIANDADVTAGRKVDNKAVVSGYIYHCRTARNTKEGFRVSDWDSVVKYTDDTAAINAQKAIDAINDDDTLSIYEKSCLLDVVFEITGSRNKYTFSEVVALSDNENSSLRALYNKAYLYDSIDMDDWMDSYETLMNKLYSLGVFNANLENTPGFIKEELLQLFNDYYTEEQNIKYDIEECKLEATRQDLLDAIQVVDDKLSGVDDDTVLSVLEKNILLTEWTKVAGTAELYDVDTVIGKITSEDIVAGSFCDLYKVSLNYTTYEEVTDALNNLKTYFNAYSNYLSSVECNDTTNAYPSQSTDNVNCRVYTVLNSQNQSVLTSNNLRLYVAIPSLVVHNGMDFDTFGTTTPVYGFVSSPDAVSDVTTLKFTRGTKTLTNYEPPIKIEEVSEDLKSLKFISKNGYFNVANGTDLYLVQDGGSVDVKLSQKTFNRDELRDVMIDYFSHESVFSSKIEEAKLKVFDANTYLNKAIEEGSTDIQGGLVLTNILEVKNESDEVTGGLCGLTTDPTSTTDSSSKSGAKNIGMWLGGDLQAAINTLTPPTNSNASTKYAPVVLTKAGQGSKIGCFNVGGTDHIYVKASSCSNATVMHNDYISLGASYDDSNTKTKANQNAKIVLNADGSGHLAGGNILWDTNGVSTYKGNIKIGEESKGVYPIELNTSGAGHFANGNISWNASGELTIKSELKLNKGSETPVWLTRDGEGSKIGPLKVLSETDLFVGEPSEDYVVTTSGFEVNVGSDIITETDSGNNTRKKVRVPGTTDKYVTLYYESYDSETDSYNSKISNNAGIGKYILRDYEKTIKLSKKEGVDQIKYTYTTNGNDCEFTLKNIGKEYTTSYDYFYETSSKYETKKIYNTYEEVFIASSGNSLYESSETTVGILLPHPDLGWTVVSPIFDARTTENTEGDETKTVITIDSVIIPLGIKSNGNGTYNTIYKRYDSTTFVSDSELTYVRTIRNIDPDEQGILLTNNDLKLNDKRYGTVISKNGISTESFTSLTDEFGFTNMIMKINKTDTTTSQYFLARPSLLKLNTKLKLLNTDDELKSKKITFNVNNLEDGTVVLGTNTFNSLTTLLYKLTNAVYELIGNDTEEGVTTKTDKKSAIRKCYNELKNSLDKFAVVMVKHNSTSSSNTGVFEEIRTITKSDLPEVSFDISKSNLSLLTRASKGFMSIK